MTGPRLHLVTADEVETTHLRAEALRRFRARYRHDSESQRTMTGALHRLATVFSEGTMDERTFPWELLVDEDLVSVMWGKVAERYARHTAAKDASALRVMLLQCHRVGLLTYEEYRHATSFEARGGHNTSQAGHYLSEDDLAVIVTTCAAGTGGRNTRIRDCALVMALASTGARGNEITGVHLADVADSESRIWLRRTKSGTPRNGWLHPHATMAVERWLEVRGTESGPLFVPLSRTGRPLHDRGALSTHQVWKIISRRSTQAGLPGITPHDLRRFAITTMLENGVDIALVAKTVGHTKTETTASYDRRPAIRQRDAVAGLRLPALTEFR